MAAVDKLTPSDSRVQHRTYTVPASNHTYHYLFAEPPARTTVTGTALLIHGFPDLALGWRYQVPALVSLGLRVIVPDMLGYGGTDAPEKLEEYSYKSVTNDLVALVRHVLREAGHKDPESEKIILGGHDWGGMVAWRFALWHPSVLRCVFSVCTPYFAPISQPITLEVLTSIHSNFRYQLQFRSGECEARVGRDPARVRAFLGALYGGRALMEDLKTIDEGRKGLFDPEVGIPLDLVEQCRVGPSPLLSKEEMDYYVEQFATGKGGIKGACNWYRMTEINNKEEMELAQAGRVNIRTPALMVVARKDVALKPELAGKMKDFIENLKMVEVDASHWALWERPAEVNAHLTEWLRGILDREGRLRPSI